MEIYKSGLLHWVFVDRWYFKNWIKCRSQCDLFDIWDDVKNTRTNDVVRRDMGRILINESGNFK